MSIKSGTLLKWGGASIRKQEVSRYRYTRGEWAKSGALTIAETIPMYLTLVSWNAGCLKTNSACGGMKIDDSEADMDETARTVVVTIRRYLRGQRKFSISSRNSPPSAAPNSPDVPTSPTVTSSPSSNGTIILLQQVCYALFISLLNVDWLKENFRVVPGPNPYLKDNQNGFSNIWSSTGSSPFANVTFLSRGLSIAQANSLIFHNSVTKRHALIVDLELNVPSIPSSIPSKPTSPITSHRTSTDKDITPDMNSDNVNTRGHRRGSSLSSTNSTPKSPISSSPSKVIRIINANLEPSVFDKSIRDEQILLVKGCLSEKGVYAALGAASVGPVSGKCLLSKNYEDKVREFGITLEGKGVGEEKEKQTYLDGEESKEIEKELEDVNILRKIWARGPVHLENPCDVMLQSSTADGVRVGIGVMHCIRVT